MVLIAAFLFVDIEKSSRFTISSHLTQIIPVAGRAGERKGLPHSVGTPGPLRMCRYGSGPAPKTLRNLQTCDPWVQL